MEAIDHLDLVVSDLERSLRFYRGLLAPLGYVGEAEIAGERGERVVYLSRHGGGGSLSLRAAQSDAAPDAVRPLRGRHPPHLPSGLEPGRGSRPSPPGRAARGRRSAASSRARPREYDYSPGYYAVFIHDPDGIKLEVLSCPSESDLAARVLELERRLAGLDG